MLPEVYRSVNASGKFRAGLSLQPTFHSKHSWGKVFLIQDYRVVCFLLYMRQKEVKDDSFQESKFQADFHSGLAVFYLLLFCILDIRIRGCVQESTF